MIQPQTHTIPSPHSTYPILQYLTTTFNLTHSYFSSLVTCPTNIHKYCSPFTRDKVFGSLGTSFQYKWKGFGFVHLITPKKLNKPFTGPD